MTFQTTSIKTRSGLTFTADVAGPADGPLVLMLHGFPESRHSWRAALPALASAGYRAVAPDQRRLGLARVMLVSGLQWAIGRGAHRMMLEVEHDNEAAINLYRGYGFRSVAKRPDYYGPGGHALILERGLRARSLEALAEEGR